MGLFLAKIRPEVIQEIGSSSDVCAITRLGAQRWKQVSDSDKQPFIVEAGKAMAVYKVDRQVYTASAGFKKYQRAKKAFEKKRNAKKPASWPKRAPSAYFIFLREKREDIIAELGDRTKVAPIAKRAGEMWRAATDAEKQPYIEKAEAAKAEYQAMAAYKQSADYVNFVKSKARKAAKAEKDEKKADG